MKAVARVWVAVEEPFAKLLLCEVQEPRAQRENVCVCGTRLSAQNTARQRGLQKLWLSGLHQGGPGNQVQRYSNPILYSLQFHSKLYKSNFYKIYLFFYFFIIIFHKLERRQKQEREVMYNGCCKKCMKAFSRSGKSCLCQVPNRDRKTPLPPGGCVICGCHGFFFY